MYYSCTPLVVIYDVIRDCRYALYAKARKALCFRGYGKQSAPEDYGASRGRSLGNWRPTIDGGTMPRLRGVPELNDSTLRRFVSAKYIIGTHCREKVRSYNVD